MTIIYSKKNGEVFGRFDHVAFDAEGILKGYYGPTNERWSGYHPSMEPASYNLTKEQDKAYDDSKLYSFNEETKELTERERPLTPEEEAEKKYDALDAQIAYTAMMTGTLI